MVANTPIATGITRRSAPATTTRRRSWGKVDEDNTGRVSHESTETFAEKYIRRISMVPDLVAPVGSLLPGGLLGKLQRPSAATLEKSRHIFAASDIVSEAFLDQIRTDKSTVSLEIEDLITDKCYRSLISRVKSLLCAGDREWQSICFVDFVAPEEFITWRGHKHAVMNDLAKCYELNCNPLKREQTEFKAIIEFQPGTSIKTFLDTLRKINQHNLVHGVQFFGALFNCDKRTIATKLEECVNQEGGLTTSIRLEVSAGLVENPERFELLQMCLYKGRDIVNKISMDGSSSRSQSDRTGAKTREIESGRPGLGDKRRVRSARLRRIGAPESPTRANRRRRTAPATSSPSSVANLYSGDASTNAKEYVEVAQLPPSMPLARFLNREENARRHSSGTVSIASLQEPCK